MLCYVMYGSWDIDLDGQNVLPFWTIFCHFTSLTTQKIKFLKKWKNNRTYYHFTHVYHNVMHIWFLRYEAWQTKWRTTWTIKILKKWKKSPRDMILHKCTKNHDHMLHCSWDSMCDKCYFLFLFLGYFLPFTPLTI